MARICEDCVHLDYDPEEDEMARLLRGDNSACPFYRRSDDYETARRQ